MASVPALPNEIMLLILKRQTSIPALLFLSSVNRNIRSLYLQNSNSLLSSVCKSSTFLAAAKILAETVAEIAALPTHTCDCEDHDCEHWHKDLAGQQYAADAQSGFPSELRLARAVSRVVSLSTMAAESAARFWTSEAEETCATNHAPLKFDTARLAQVYMYLWLSTEVHFSPDHTARFVETVPELVAPATELVSDMYRFVTMKMDRSTQLRLGIADPEADESEITSMASQDPDQDWHFARMEWCLWPDLERFVRVPRERRMGQIEWKNLATEWQKKRPQGCSCPGVVLTDWDRVRVDWWDTWDHKAGKMSEMTRSSSKTGMALMTTMVKLLMGYEHIPDYPWWRLRED